MADHSLVVNTSTLFAQDDALPRRIALGVQVKPVSAETQQRLKLRNNRGVEVQGVVPESTAAAADLKPGDVILALGDQPIKDVPSFVEQVASMRAGTQLQIKIQRSDVAQTVAVNPKPLPLETSPDFDIEYGHVKTNVGRLRTVITFPKGQAKAPGVMLLSGLGLGFVEHPTADPLGMKAIAYALTRQGFAVMRVDRPGCGDSEGGPARDADFHAVVTGYTVAARTLKQHARIDPQKVSLIGFSAGALEAPLVAAKVPVQNIAVFGSLTMNWQEYLQSTTRRQLHLSGSDAGKTEQHVALQSAAWHYLIYEGLAPDDIASAHPELSDWVDENWVDGKYFSGIHYKFFQQLGKSNIAEAWEMFQGRVLAVWGDKDFVTDKNEHELIASIANKHTAGNGKLLVLAGVDHNLQIPGAAASVIEAILDWLEQA